MAYFLGWFLEMGILFGILGYCLHVKDANYQKYREGI